MLVGLMFDRGSGIQDPGFRPDPDPGVKKAPDPEQKEKTPSQMVLTAN